MLILLRLQVAIILCIEEKIYKHDQIMLAFKAHVCRLQSCLEFTLHPSLHKIFTLKTEVRRLYCCLQVTLST